LTVRAKGLREAPTGVEYDPSHDFIWPTCR